MKTIFSLFSLFFLFSAVAYSQAISDDDEFFPILLDGKKAFMSRETGEIKYENEMGGPAAPKPQETTVLNPKPNPVRTPGASVTNNQTTHTVEKGETLYGISRFYGVPVDEICQMNGIDKNNVLPIGTKLKIQKNSEVLNPIITNHSYTVKKGDTLYSISKKLGITVFELKRINHLDSDLVSVGQELQTR